MPKLPALGLVTVVVFCGCHSDDHVDARVGRHDRAVAVDECAARMAVYPPNSPLPAPYRVLAPVDTGFVGNWGWSATSRYWRMKKRACQLGADAILDAEAPIADNRVTTTLQYDAYGRPVEIVQEQPVRERRPVALAIQFAQAQVVVVAHPQ
jgi:hypothetical protein